MGQVSNARGQEAAGAAAGQSVLQSLCERPGVAPGAILMAVFATEAGIMLALQGWPPMPAWPGFLADAAFLTLALLPWCWLAYRFQAGRRPDQHLDAVRADSDDFESLVANSGDGTLVLDLDGVVQYANGAAETLLGCRLPGSQFGFPVLAGSVTEIEISRGNRRGGSAEMRMARAGWRGRPAIIVSLRDITANVRLREQLREQALTDELTGLKNRRGFLFLAEHQMKLAERTRSRLLLLFADLDRLKRINDTLGHAAGDQALAEVARILRKIFRGSDIIARIGGDEFAVLTTNTDGLDEDVIARRLEAGFEEYNRKQKGACRLSLSFGVTHYDPAYPIAIGLLMTRADRRMYRRKEAGRADTENDAAPFASGAAAKITDG